MKLPFFILSLLLAICTSALAQEKPLENVASRDFQGFWQIKEPAGDVCNLYIKPGGRASVFWSGNKMNNVLKGKWELQDNRLIITWDSGYRNVIVLTGPKTILRHGYPAGVSLSAEPENSTRGEKFTQNLVGSLTTEGSPEKAERPAAARESSSASDFTPFAVSDFVGYWRIEGGSSMFGIFGGSRDFYLQLNRDGTFRSALFEGGAEAGTWTDAGGAARLLWDNGRRDLLRRNGSNYELAHLGKTEGFSASAKSTTVAEKQTSVEAQAYFKAADTRQITVEDIIGGWARIPFEEQRELIIIERWGKARRETAIGAPIKGNWVLQNDRVVIRWENQTSTSILISSSGALVLEFGEGKAVTATADERYEARRVRPQDVPELRQTLSQARSGE